VRPQGTVSARPVVGREHPPRLVEMAALMSTPVMCARPSGVVAAQTKPLRASGFYGNASSLSTSASARGVAGRGALVINMAASKAKKSRDLGMLKGMLEKEETLLVAGFNFQGLRVRTPNESWTRHFRDARATASRRDSSHASRHVWFAPRPWLRRPRLW
jgi:hypothetical protein